jgi:predicted membrane channel-forming protein YqfA (hemolysin III family)
MVLPRARLTLVVLLLFAMKENFSEGTIATSRGKACYKFLFLACQLLVFFASARYKVVKIAHSCSEMVLRTTKHTMIYPGSGPSLEVIALRLAV